MSKIDPKLVTQFGKLDLKGEEILLIYVPLVHGHLDDEIRATLSILGYTGQYIILPDCVRLDHLTQETQKSLGLGIETIRNFEVTHRKVAVSILPSTSSPSP